MSQNIRATGASLAPPRDDARRCSGRAGPACRIPGPGCSPRWPSRRSVMPSSRAPSSSAGVIAKLFREPSTSVNQSRTNRTPRSSTVRRTYSSWRSMRASVRTGAVAFPQAGAAPVTERSHSGNGREIAADEAGSPQPKWAGHGQCGMPGRRGAGDERDLQGRVHLDRRHRADRPLRSKTKILEDGKELPIWGFDGSSTNQAPGSTPTACCSRCSRAPTRSAAATTCS